MKTFWNNKKNEKNDEKEYVEGLIGAPIEYVNKIEELCYEHGFKYEIVSDPSVEGRALVKVAFEKEGLDKAFKMANSFIGKIL